MELIFENDKNNPDYEGIKWCLSARSSNILRKNLTMINIDSGLMVATDGNRLHLFSPVFTDTIDGNWEVKTCGNKITVLTKDESGQVYPDYERLFKCSLHNGIPRLPTDRKEKSDKSMHYETGLVYHLWKTLQKPV